MLNVTIRPVEKSERLNENYKKKVKNNFDDTPKLRIWIFGKIFMSSGMTFKIGSRLR